MGGGGQEPHTSLRRLTSLPMVGARATVRVVAPASPPCIAVASAKPQQISNTRTDHSQISPLFHIHSCTPHSHFLLPNPLCQHPGSLSPYLLLLILSASLLSLQSHHLSLSVSPRHTHTHITLKGSVSKIMSLALFFFFFSLFFLYDWGQGLKLPLSAQ